ncbi:MAG: sulfite exporter TauE/SafE family protein [bacterium]
MDGIETVFSSLPRYLMVSAVLLVAEAVYVMFGFGAGLIAVGALAVILPEIQDVVVLLLLINVLPELYVVFRSRHRVTWRGIATICLGIAVGVPLGTRLLQVKEPTIILVVLGCFLVVAGSAFLLVPARRNVSWPAWSGPPVGLISGLLSGLFGTGGPPLIFYYQLGGLEKAVFRGNLMAIFLLVGLVRLPCYGVAGPITTPRLWSALAVMPAVLLGAWLGNRIHLQLAETTFRRLVSICLVLIGVVILWQRLAVGS